MEKYVNDVVELILIELKKPGNRRVRGNVKVYR